MRDNELNLKIIPMQLFLADCQFPDIENQVKAYQLFVEAWENGEIAKSDKTDKFEMLFRVHAPGEGRVVCLCKAESDKEIFDHFAPWRAKFGIHMEFTPVISCQNIVDYHKDLFKTLG
ncbi:hypothetical protein EV01_1264 [Prochlorococcus marinus str. MIT 9401]|uniref:DUF3303 domain-containing protein n=2 Tax=Prochlorococcaceae TaxID=2881426 RepID=A0A0A2B2C4_PROMR|nr:hypothetical protein EV01_1264 [Prochlorococcus marinus str. MIT 9401]